MRRILFHHAAQAGDLHVDRTLHRGIFTAARQVHQLIAGERLTRMADQRLQYRKLAAGERHWFIFTEHFAGAEVEFELTKSDNSFFLRRRARQLISLATQHSADTRQQLTRVKRFWNVVVGTNLQAHDTVNLFPFRRHHNDRHRVTLAAQTAANRQAIFAG
jgi:N-glycosylase/DNA lyase